MKNKSVQNCRFVHHSKFHCLVTTLNRLFKIEFERGETGKEPRVFLNTLVHLNTKSYHETKVLQRSFHKSGKVSAVNEK